MGKQKIIFFNRTSEDLRVFFPSAKKLAFKILRNFNGDISFIFVSLSQIKRLNKNFLGKDNATDVITFNLPNISGKDIGEVYICLPQAKKHAQKYGHHLYCELMILLVHGCLHLLGKEDYTSSQRKAMNKETLKWLKSV